MKALTLFDPWATLVVLGAKQYETRSWPTSHRGPLAIHVSKKWDTELQAQGWQEPFYSAALGRADFGVATGCIIGMVDIQGIFPTSSWQCESSLELTEKERAFGSFSPGRWAWRLYNPRRLATPIPCTGHQGIWNVPPDIAAKVSRQRHWVKVTPAGIEPRLRWS